VDYFATDLAENAEVDGCVATDDEGRWRKGVLEAEGDDRGSGKGRLDDGG
jgi:hypothetical protein